MLFRDIILHDVDVDAQRNPFKNTAVEKRATEDQNNKNFIHHLFFTYILNFLFFCKLIFRRRDLLCLATHLILRNRVGILIVNRHM